MIKCPRCGDTDLRSYLCGKTVACDACCCAFDIADFSGAEKEILPLRNSRNYGEASTQ